MRFGQRRITKFPTEPLHLYTLGNNGTLPLKLPGLLGFSFLTINAPYGNYAKDPIGYFSQLLLAKICYFKKHSVPFLVRIMDGQGISYPTYQKVSIVEELLPLADWLYYSDMDVVVVKPEVSPYSMIQPDHHLILTDHNAALNNGAFFMKNSEESLEFVKLWKAITTGVRDPFRRIWPFTDNGAMIEAIIQWASLMQYGFTRSSRCASRANNIDAFPQKFLLCEHDELEQLSGRKFDGKSDRSIEGKVMLYRAIPGFNNHYCTREYTTKYGWLPDTCYRRGESFAIHSKGAGKAKFFYMHATYLPSHIYVSPYKD